MSTANVPASLRARARAIFAAHDWYPEADAMKQAKSQAVCEALQEHGMTDPRCPTRDQAWAWAAWAIGDEAIGDEDP